MGIVDERHRIVVKRGPEAVLVLESRSKVFGFGRQIRSGDALLDQYLRVEAANSFPRSFAIEATVREEVIFQNTPVSSNS